MNTTTDPRSGHALPGQGSGVLITGSHRSGSTWVGRVMSRSNRLLYIREPFHLEHDPGICKARFRHWFTYITGENEDGYVNALRDMVEMRYSWWRAFLHDPAPARWRDKARRYLVHRQARKQGVMPLVKDPLALFSTEWLADPLGLRPIVLIRHPAAFAGSLKGKNWTHPFSHFLEQPLLMRDHLAPYEAEIRAFAEREHDIIDQAGLLWKLIHHMVAGYRARHPEWAFVRHEDLSNDPLEGFSKLFQHVGVPFGEVEKQAVLDYSDNARKGPEGYVHEQLRRDSAANVHSWRTRLEPSEIYRLRRSVEEVSSLFYDDTEW
ncbi:MAG: sulfotransferase [Flavobacteriales bacterium]|nr:sulfotransferase [Flavobacteriales bacterium]